MSKWIEYQPVIDEIKHEWCNKCNKTCPYNNCKIYRVMQILRRQKPIPHETKRPQGDIRWTDKLTVTRSGDIIDFEDRVVGHINLEDMIGGAE